MDPYAESPQIPPPRDRNRDPRDPREPYTRKYTTLLSIPEPFPSTGSFDFRRGVFDERPMTVKEQNFEQFVNNRQAEYDISSAINEWQRLKAHEEDAIRLWLELDGNLEEYQRQMRTRDQQAMELQCQRKKYKALILQQWAESSRGYEQEYLNAAARRAFREAVDRRVMESGARGGFTEAQKSRPMESAAQKTVMDTVNRKLAEFRKTMEAAAATDAQETPSEMASATDVIGSVLNPYLESGGESSHSPSHQQSGSADSVSRDPGSPSLPTDQPIDNTSQPPQTSPRQPPALTQSSQNSSNSASPPRSSNIDNSTPPSSKHPSPPESPKPSPPNPPTASRFVPDPAIWGTSNLHSSSNHPSQSPSLNPSPQLPPFNPTATNTPNVPRHHPYPTGVAHLNSMRYQHHQPVPTSSTNEPTLGEQSRHDVPIDRRIRNIQEIRRKRAPGGGDSFVTIVMRGPAGGFVDW